MAWLKVNSRQPMNAAQVWAECFTALRIDTNEIVLSRDELAERVGVRPAEVSRIMTELETCGAVIRRREGRGVRFFMNPMVGTHMTGAARDKAQDAAPAMLRPTTP
jgi:DNA-binding transcriptional ArsR family regulator